MDVPYNSKNSRAQLMTLGFRNTRQLKCTQSYIKKSFHRVILKRSQRLRKYWYQSTNDYNVKIDKNYYTRASFKIKNKEHNTWVRIIFLFYSWILVFISVGLVMVTSSRVSYDIWWGFTPTSEDASSPRSRSSPVTCWSLYNLKVVQYRHDVLRHEDISCVQGHPHDGDQHGIWVVVKETISFLFTDSKGNPPIFSTVLWWSTHSLTAFSSVSRNNHYSH